MRNALVIGFAIFIDTIQLLLGLGAFSLQVLPVVGQMAGVLAGALGDIISFVFGAAFIVTLIFTGMFSWGAVLGGSIAEMIPIADLFIPGWTLMAWRCVSVKKQEEARHAAAQQQASPAAPEQTTQAPPQAFDGIRAANDNTYGYQAAA